MDIKRLLYFAAFATSLLLLWNAWRDEHPAPSTTMTVSAPAEQEVPQRGKAMEADFVPVGEKQNSTSEKPAALPRIKVTTDVFEAEIDPIGASLVRLVLIRHKATADPQKPFVLLDSTPTDFYVAQTGLIGQGMPNHQSVFTLIGRTGAPGQPQTLTFSAETSQGVRVVKIYRFTLGSYLIGLSQVVENHSNQPLAIDGYYQLARHDLTADEKEARGLDRTHFGPAFYTPDVKFQKLSFEDVAENNRKADAKPLTPMEIHSGWIAMVQHHFVGAWIPVKSQKGAFDLYTRALGGNRYSAGVIAPFGTIKPGASAAERINLYAGPQEQKKLEAIADGFNLVVDYGWLTIIASPIYWLLEFLHGFVNNWGGAIILLTLIIKLIFFPLTAASQKSMAKMKDVAPRIKQLQELYKDDRERLNKEMMALYQTEKINPLGGCLPILVQIPVFIALYWVLLSAVELRHAPFALWITDLSSKDPYFVLPILLGISSLVQTRMNPPPADPIQAKVITFLPIIFTVMFLWFPSGLVLYWMISNLVSIAQQWYIMRHLHRHKVKRTVQQPEK